MVGRRDHEPVKRSPGDVDSVDLNVPLDAAADLVLFRSVLGEQVNRDLIVQIAAGSVRQYKFEARHKFLT